MARDFLLSHISCVIKIRDEVLIKAFGNRVRELRKGKGLTMERLAEAAGIDVRQLSYIELGQVNITISSMNALAKALKLTLAQLVELDIATQ
jgi:transcriptional regulator with XRE-family HTH domain